MEDPVQKPRVKTMCLFIHRGKTLATKGYDEKKNETFYRLIGGSINFGEKTEDGIRREVNEELGCEIENLELLKVIENIFTYNGNQGHDIVFLYKGELSNKTLYDQEKIHIVEPYAEFEAEWILIDDVLAGKTILYPALDYSKILK
jgi:ADP-ribose pyrophosphatase YjhB (NUDIX family)